MALRWEAINNKRSGKGISYAIQSKRVDVMSLQEFGRDDSQPIINAILDNTMAVIYAKDRAGRYQLINGRFEELFGITTTHIQGLTDHDLFEKELADKFHQNDQKVLRRNEAIEFEEVAPHADGPHTYISLKFPYRDDIGNAIGTCGISTDITPRKTVEAALQRSEERFRQLADNVPECFWITDITTMRVLYVNPAFEKIWQRPCKEIYENPEAWIEAIHPDDRNRIGKSFSENAAAGNFKEEYRIVLPNGDIRWIADRGFPVQNERGEIYRVAGIAQDITQRRLLEQQVVEISNHERQRISRELHDSLGQQLTGLGYLAKSLTNRLSQTESPEAEKAELILDGIQESIAEVRNIVRGLTPVAIDSYGLKAALQDLAATTSRYSNIACELDYPDEVAIDDNAVATQLYRIAQEATNNAIKHAGASSISIRLRANDGSICLEISDDGQKSSDCDDGLGLGLHTMEYRSKLIGAEFRFNQTNHGTTVTCILSQEICNEHEIQKDDSRTIGR